MLKSRTPKAGKKPPTVLKLAWKSGKLMLPYSFVFELDPCNCRLQSEVLTPAEIPFCIILLVGSS